MEANQNASYHVFTTTVFSLLSCKVLACRLANPLVLLKLSRHPSGGGGIFPVIVMQGTPCAVKTLRSPATIAASKQFLPPPLERSDQALDQH